MSRTSSGTACRFMKLILWNLPVVRSLHLFASQQIVKIIVKKMENGTVLGAADAHFPMEIVKKWDWSPIF